MSVIYVQKGHSKFSMEMENWDRPLWKIGKFVLVLQMNPRAELPITDPPKVWVSGFQSVNGNGKLVLAIRKMALAPQKRILQQNFKLPTPQVTYV